VVVSVKKLEVRLGEGQQCEADGNLARKHQLEKRVEKPCGAVRVIDYLETRAVLRVL